MAKRTKEEEEQAQKTALQREMIAQRQKELADSAVAAALKTNQTERNRNKEYKKKYKSKTVEELRKASKDDRRHGQELWATDMVNMWHSLESITAAVATSRAHPLNWLANKLAPYTEQGVDLLTKKWLENTYKTNPSQINLPKILHFIEPSNDGVLDLRDFKNNVRCSDGKELSEEQFALLKKSFEIWIKNNGYDMSFPRGERFKFVIKDGSRQLSKEEIIKMRDDPDKGLTALLERSHHGLNFVQEKPEESERNVPRM